MFGRCKHEWVKQTEVLMPSVIEQVKESGIQFEGSGTNSFTTFSKKLVIIFTCSKCPKIRKFTETHPS